MTQNFIQTTINLTMFYATYGFGLTLALTQIFFLIIYKESNYGFRASYTTFIMIVFLAIFGDEQHKIPLFIKNDFVTLPTGFLTIFTIIFLIVQTLFAIKSKIEIFKKNKIKKQEEKERKERLSKIR